MPKPLTTASQIGIKMNRQPLPPSVTSMLTELVVEQHAYLPDMFVMQFDDTSLSLLDEGPFELTKGVTITAVSNDGEQVTLIDGEITALEPSFTPEMLATLVVRGYDRSHRLYRASKSTTFVNQKDSDIAKKIAQQVQLGADVASTPTVYDHIFQANQSDMAFLMARGWRIGYECFVKENKLHFRPPTTSGQALTLQWGEDLLAFYPRLSLAEQVDEVTVRGWDPQTQKPIVGQAKAGNGRLYPNIKERKNGADWAKPFGKGNQTIVDQPVVSQAEANLLAQARLDERSGTYLTASGEAFRRPDLRAGNLVTLEGLGKRLSGTYLLTHVRHEYSRDGLLTHFEVQGSRTGTLLGAIAEEPPQPAWFGVVTAVVTNTDDPNQWGRVKLKFPWLSEEAESSWARLAAPGAGPKAGLCAIPDVGHEVLVAFEQGDFNRPIVLGGLWNGRHPLPPQVSAAGQGEMPTVRTFHTPTGHYLSLDEVNKTAELSTAAQFLVRLDEGNKTIELTTPGGVTVKLDDNSKTIELSSDNISLKGGTLKLEAEQNMELTASGEVKIKGSMIHLN